MPFGQVVVGPPGSGKTTYCWGAYQFLTASGRKVAVVNLDPANDHIPYPCAINIADLITLEDTMNDLKLGPNGGIMFCVEYLLKNMDWLLEKLDELKDHYIIFDFPGQVELFTHHNAVKEILGILEKHEYRLVAAHLVDAHYCTDPAKYISVLLLSLKTMVQLELPHVNILSKVDLIESYGKLRFNLQYYTDVMDLSYLLESLNDDAFGSKFKKLNEALCDLIEDFALVGFYTLCVEDKTSMTKIQQVIDKAGGFVFGGLTEGNESIMTTAMQAGYHEDVTDVQERWMDNDVVDDNNS
ncbi:GPN-loop GTPase [Absidia repens]|uniref:GPN-loop GTPase 2 n=1 Tax=Absidia repens TaxID=90262 RepID=A0A1X2IDI7_9FUNG|nr:GPN-loop GTPase [Absidia repens]